SGELVIGKTNLTIIGRTAAGITVSGNNASRVFHTTRGTVAICNLTIANGNDSSGAGGAGLYNEAGCTLLLSNCTVMANAAATAGGLRNAGTATVVNCTFSGNSASFAAGAIFNSAGALSLFNSTVASNTSPAASSAVRNVATMNVRSSIIAGNTAGSTPDVSGAFVSQGYNLIGNANGSTGF